MTVMFVVSNVGHVLFWGSKSLLQTAVTCKQRINLIKGKQDFFFPVSRSYLKDDLTPFSLTMMQSELMVSHRLILRQRPQNKMYKSVTQIRTVSDPMEPDVSALQHKQPNSLIHPLHPLLSPLQRSRETGFLFARHLVEV